MAETSQRHLEIRAYAAEIFGDPVNSHERVQIARMYDEISASTRREVEGELLEFVEEAVIQACLDDKDIVDSMAISTWAEGIRLLAAHGRAEIIEEHGRRVIARLTTPELEPPDEDD